MKKKFLLSAFATAALMISGSAFADKGKSKGKGNNPAAHGQKAERRDPVRRWVMDEPESRNEARRTAKCPPGLAKKNNGCLAPGLAKKRFSQGARLPAAFRSNNVPAAYADKYRDTATSLYRYNAGSIYRIDRATRRIGEVISVPTL